MKSIDTMNSNLPRWRAGAPAGLSLSRAMSLSGETVRPVAAAVPAARPFERIVLPNTSLQWRSADVEYYSPERVGFILQNGISGDLQSQWQLFDMMEDTWPRLAKNLSEIKRAVASMDWVVEAWSEDEEAATPQAAERAKLVSHCLWRMQPQVEAGERDFEGLIYDLLDAWGKGLSVCELIWEDRSVPNLGDVVALRGSAWVHPVAYGLGSDGTLGLRFSSDVGSMYSTRPAGVQPFPANKFVVAAAPARTTHFSSAAMLRPLAWWWAAANFGASWLLNYAQLFGVPIRWATYPAGSPETLVTAIGSMLANMGSAGWAAFPEGTQLQLHEGSKTAGSSPQESIVDRADKYCDLLVLGQTLTTDAADRGTQALGNVHERVRGDVMLSAANWVTGILNSQLVPAILTLNYGDTELGPEIEAKPKREEDKLALAQRDEILARIGLRLPEKFMYERHHVPIPAPDEPTVEKPAAAPMPQASGQPPAEPPPESGRPPAEAASAGPNPANSAQRKIDAIVWRAMSDSVGARTRWLEPLAAEMNRLIEAAANERLSDTELLVFLESAQRKLPELFGKMDHAALAASLESAMGAAAVEGLKASPSLNQRR